MDQWLYIMEDARLDKDCPAECWRELDGRWSLLPG